MSKDNKLKKGREIDFTKRRNDHTKPLLRSGPVTSWQGPFEAKDSRGRANLIPTPVTYNFDDL